MQLADQKEIAETYKAVEKLYNEQHGAWTYDPFENPMDDTADIMTLQNALNDRQDMMDTCLAPYPESQDYQDVQNDIDNLKDWKKKGIKWVCIDGDITATNGRCCLVYDKNLNELKNDLQSLKKDSTQANV